MWGLKTKVLHTYGTDITMLADMRKLDPVTGRANEMQSLIEALLKRRNNNACLVGDAGVGKTAIVEALANKIANRSVPPKLIGRKVFSIDMVRLGDGAMHGGEFEKRLKDVFDEVRASEGWVILFIDDLHNLLKNKRGDGVATILKSALATSDFMFIGATTPEEYTRLIEMVGASKSMFETIQVREPSRKDCILMLQGIISKYEHHHGVIYTKNALQSAVNSSKQCTRDILLPGRAINLIDKAGARAHALGKTHVTHDEIEHVVSTSTGGLGHVSREELNLLFQLEGIMKRSIIGQDEVVVAICGSIRRARVRIRDEEEKTKSIGCFLFVGPTGVGKTEMAKVLCREYFGSEAAMVRLDTSKSMENHTVSRLISQFTEEVRRCPHSLVLFDEIEKAHDEALNVVRQIIDFGRLIDDKGETVYFSSTIIILTSDSSDAALLVHGLDQVVVFKFKPLENEHLENILDIMIERFRKRVLAKKKILVEFSKRLKELLILDKSCGARGLKRDFTYYVETKLADEILCGRVAPHDTVMLDVTLTGDVECQTVSRAKIHHQTQTHTTDVEYKTVSGAKFRYQIQTHRDSNSVTRVTIGGVDVRLIAPHIPKNNRNVIKNGMTIMGMDVESFDQLIESLKKK